MAVLRRTNKEHEMPGNARETPWPSGAFLSASGLLSRRGVSAGIMLK